MRLTVLSVAYPFVPVSIDAVGGAEQVLCALDRALVCAGHHSIVIACEGSNVAGTLVPMPRPTGLLTPDRMDRTRRRYARAIMAALRHWPVDVVHLHGIDFDCYLPPPGAQVLATLHLPVDWYAASSVALSRGGTWLNCVSRTQHMACPASPRFIEPIENGVPVELFSTHFAKRRFALALARVCPEKGIHLAIDAAKSVGMPLLIGGQVFPYADHQRYFEQEIVPRLDCKRRFIGPVGLKRKRRLLASAHCVVVPSLVAETSSLVAREALASGTPVVAFARGALVETIDHGRTGFLVDDVAEMATAIARADELSPDECRKTARARFSLERMIAQYFAVYERLAEIQRRPRQADAA